VASAIIRIVPVRAFTPKAHQMIGYSRSRGFTGIERDSPSRRRLIAPIRPASTIMPMVCTVRMVGCAQTEGDSTTHRLKGRFSRLERKSFIAWLP